MVIVAHHRSSVIWTANIVVGAIDSMTQMGTFSTPIGPILTFYLLYL